MLKLGPNEQIMSIERVFRYGDVFQHGKNFYRVNGLIAHLGKYNRAVVEKVS